MNRNARNHKKTDDQNVHGLGKVSFWEKYGAKRFPYRGRHRYSPLVYRSEDGGIVISNDVFGLTIRQFERTYNACLDRRKAHEQYILNIRYPDKTSDRYMEYLENSRYNSTDELSWTGSDFKVKLLFENLVHTAGNEIDMRKRQQLFIIRDMITNIPESAITNISSGSLAEGIDLPGSDMDIMFVIKEVDVIRDVRNIKHPLQNTTLVMETDNDNPGFAKLKLIAGGDGHFITPKSFESTGQGLYLSVNSFVSNLHKVLKVHQFSSHGPCLSDKGQNFDLTCCLRSKYLPYITMPWASRYRQQWPPSSIIDKIKKFGCLLVPIGPRHMTYCDVLWRLSFSVAEKHLLHSFNFTQLLCYCLLKLTLKHIVNTNKYVEGLLCSYFLKTALFWVSEEIDIETFQLTKLFFCFSKCLNKLLLWVKKCYCPNYFIPEHNMFLGKVNSDNNTMLLKVLDGIKCDGIDRLTNQIFPYNDGSLRLRRTTRDYSFIMLDFLFQRIEYIHIVPGMSQCLKAQMFTKYLIKSKYSAFAIDVCKQYHANISQTAAQLQHVLSTSITKEAYYIHKRYQKHLQDGMKTDAVSGWLLYASFYYVSRQFDVTLKLTDYVLSRFSPDMVLMGCANYNDEDLNNYRSHVHHSMSLRDRLRNTTVCSVKYLKNSPLIPGELQLEVNDGGKFIPPTVVSHCLRFLCYHHLGDVFSRQKSLHDLERTVKDMNFMLIDTLSISLTIVGVCYEISGDKNEAYQCYDEALQCNGSICSSAEARKLRLFEI